MIPRPRWQPLLPTDDAAASAQPSMVVMGALLGHAQYIQWLAYVRDQARAAQALHDAIMSRPALTE